MASNVRDRTAEFQRLAEDLKALPEFQNGSRKSAAPPHPVEDSWASGAYKDRSQFSQLAAQIGLGIQKTSQKLQRLTQLAKSTSLFDDPTSQINELTMLVKQDIQTLNQQLSDLQSISLAAQRNGKQSAEHSSTVVDNLRSRLKETTSSFKGVLELRKENLKKNQDRKQLFTGAGRGDAPGNSERQPLFQAMDFAGHLGENGGAQPPIPSFMMSEQQQQELLQPQDTYLSSRAEALQNVESTIMELGGIFQQLATMVQEQGELAIRIDENIEDTLSNVTNAQAQLLKYLNTISSNRWLIMKIFMVLIVFLIFFVIFLT